MKCAYCNNEVLNSDKFCSKCGEKNEFYFESGVRKEEDFFRDEKSNQYSGVNSTRYVEKEKGSTGFICGIIGLFIAGFILGVIAIANAKNDKRPTACYVLGIIDIIGWAIIMVSMF